MHDPLNGRFLSVDPETEGQLDLSTYHYSFNNPIMFSDPDGRWPGENLWRAIVAYYNKPLTPAQQKISRAWSVSGAPAKTQGESDKNALVMGMVHAVPGMQPGSFRRPANMYKPGTKGTNSLAKTTNSVPETVARVIPEDAMKYAQSLDRPGVEDVFVTAASDLKGINTSEGISNRRCLSSSRFSLFNKWRVEIIY